MAKVEGFEPKTVDLFMKLIKKSADERARNSKQITELEQLCSAHDASITLLPVLEALKAEIALYITKQYKTYVEAAAEAIRCSKKEAEYR